MAKNAKVLNTDTTQTSSADASAIRFVVGRGETCVLRSTEMTGSAEVSVYYVSPAIDGVGQKFDNPATLDDQSALKLTASNPERLINAPGTYVTAVTVAASVRGIVFVEFG
jgi:hypothetical protein